MTVQATNQSVISVMSDSWVGPSLLNKNPMPNHNRKNGRIQSKRLPLPTSQNDIEIAKKKGSNQPNKNRIGNRLASMFFKFFCVKPSALILI
jgi:hypothetical protein